MRYLAVLALLSAAGIAAVLAGDASSAAIQLGPGVSLVSASSSNPLSLTASTSDLCPVIAYAANVAELQPAEQAQLKLAAGAAGLYAQHAEQNARAGAKPYKVTIKPIKYAQNNTQPSVDWIDLHFKSVSSGLAASAAAPAQSVKMLRSDSLSLSSAHGSMSSMSPMTAEGSMPMSMPMAAPGSSFSFGPIFLSSNDELFFGMTICASMIDCDTATHRFKPAEAEEQMQAKLRQKQQEQEQMQQQQQQQQQQEQEPVRRRSAPRAQPEHQPQQLQQQEQNQLDACPAIAYTHKLDCGDVQCKVSFVNLSPSKPLDWVDLHVVKADQQSLSHFLSLAGSQPHASALRDSGIAQFNYAMTLAAGAQPRMMMHDASSPMMPMRSSVGSQSSDDLSNAQSLHKFGAASLPDSVLAEAGGAQVFQFELPLEFKGGDLAGVSFTYCASGTDCDTELAFYKLKETGEQMQEQKQEQGKQQQQKLGLGEQQEQTQQPQQSSSLSAIGHQQKQHAVIAPRGFRGSLNQDREL